MLQFVCECDVVKDTGKEEYLRPFIHVELDYWFVFLGLTLVFGLQLEFVFPYEYENDARITDM